MTLEAAYAQCEAAAREGARDLWLGSLFAPESARRHLHALIAFEREMARLRAAVRDPQMGEIRLVWWREALTGARRDEAQGNPVAAALIDTLERFRPAPHLIENAILARQFDLYDDPWPNVGDLEAYFGETRSSLLQIGALVLSEGRDPHAAEASGLAGVALGLTDWLVGLARPRPLPLVPREAVGDLRERRMSPALTAAFRDVIALARRRLGEAEVECAKLSRALAPAYAGLATAPLWLAAAERGLASAFDRPVEVAAWRRQWALWRWMRRR